MCNTDCVCVCVKEREREKDQTIVLNLRSLVRIILTDAFAASQK